MLLYSSLELASLVVLFVFVKIRLKMNIFYQLAFVLETHLFNVQGKMLFFLLYVLNFNLVHHGKRCTQLDRDTLLVFISL